MNRLFSSDIAKSLSESVWESASFSTTGLSLSGSHWLTNDDEWDADVAFHAADVARSGLDGGGLQPGVEILAEADDYNPDDLSSIKSPEWFEYSLNPLRIAVNGIRLPLIGLMSLVFEKTKDTGVKMYSLLYMALPSLAWFLGVDSGQFTALQYRQYRPLPTGVLDVTRCEVCHTWRSDDWFLEASDETTRPWLWCLCSYRTRIHAMTDIEYLTPYSRWTDAKAHASEVGGKLCDHHDVGDVVTGVAVPPRATLDGLYMHDFADIWRGTSRQGGMRCHEHFPQIMHGWCPALMARSIDKPKGMTKPFKLKFEEMVARWIEFTSFYPEGAHVKLMALSVDRVATHTLISGEVIVIVDDPAVRVALMRRFSGDLSMYRFFMVPQLGYNHRMLASLRVALALMNNAPIQLLIVNQASTVREQAYIDHMWDSPYDICSGTPGHTYPAYAGCMLVRGRIGRTLIKDMTASLFWGGNVYGWDEVFPAYHERNVTVVFKGLAEPSVMLGLTMPNMREPKTAVVISNDVEWSARVHVILWSRQAIYWVNRVAGSDVDTGRLSFWHVWADPRPNMAAQPKRAFNKGPIWPLGARPAGQTSDAQQAAGLSYIKSAEYPMDKTDQSLGVSREWYVEHEVHEGVPPPVRVIAPGENVLQELVASLGGLRMFTLGTKGDILPFRALGKYLAKFGIPVDLYILNTPDEGKELLDASLGKRSGNDAPQIFNRARSVVLENMTGASLVHAALMVADVPTLDMAPPPDLIHPRTVAGGWMMALGSAVLGAWFVPSARVGPYTGPRVVPTSHDGEKFLKPVQNLKIQPIGAVWGSDGVPARGFEDVPVVPDGDHLVLFREYSTIVCHGGAGTVSTAAAAGCRVVVPEGGLDRSRRNPYDAGLGLVPGADPDNVFLVLADQDIRFLAFWLRKNWLKPWKLLQFYGYSGIGWFGFRILILQMLYSRAFRPVAASSEPLIVLYSVLGGELTRWYQFVMVVLGAKVVDALLDFLNISYMRVLSTFVAYNFRMSISPLALYIASQWNLGAGLAYSALTPWLYRLISAHAQAWFNLFLGVAPHPREDGETHPPVDMELSLRWWAYVFPVVHTALVCQPLDKRFEGRTIGKMYTLSIWDGGWEKGFLIPTTLRWADVEAVPRYTGVYGLAWNCHTTLTVAFRAKLVSLGIGAAVCYTTTLFAAVVYTVNASAATVVWGVVRLLPTRLSPETIRPSTLDIGGDILTSLWNRLSATGGGVPFTCPFEGIYIFLNVPEELLASEATKRWSSDAINILKIMDINASFTAKIRQLREGPILYRCDPQVPQLVSNAMKDFAASGVPEVALQPIVDSFIAAFDPTTTMHEEYQTALAQLTADVQSSDELKAYKESPALDALNRLVGTFEARAPRHTILKVARLAEFHSMFLDSELATLTTDQMVNLAGHVRELKIIEADEPDVARAAAAAQAVIDSASSLVVAWVLVLGFTPEGFRFTIKDQPVYEYDRTLTGFVFNGLSNLLPVNVADGGYMVWWTQLYSYLGATNSVYANVLRAAFPPPSLENLSLVSDGSVKDIVELCGEAFAALSTVYESEAVQLMILPRLAHMYVSALTPESQPFDLPFRNWAWAVLPELSRMAAGTFEAIGRWIAVARKIGETTAAPATLLSPLFGLFYTGCSAAYDFIDRMIEVLVYGLDKVASPLARWLKEYLYIGRAWASVILPGARRRPKAVWALLFVNDFTRLDPGTRFALSCKAMEMNQSPDYATWESNFRKAINETGLADYELAENPPLRPLRVPRHPFTVDEEVLAAAPLFEGGARHTDIMKEKMEQWVQYNVPQGIDGQWFGTPGRVGASLRRYDVDRDEPNEYTTQLVREAAHALADHYPDIYKQHKYFTLQHAMRRLKWDTNMSPGLGFMGNVRTRKLLRKHGFLAAIIEVAERRLLEGIHPGTVAHAFIKEQVVSLEKLLAGKNIRTVTAMDLMSNTLALPFSIELTRAPPPEAYVLNALPRSEGGYRPVFEDLRRHATVLQADASEFDSKLGPVLTVEGLGTLRSIAFEENPALPVIRSQIFAYLHHMRFANIVDLTTGTIYQKTGGLMTGQVNTSPDNKDSFRMMIIAAWSHVTGLPVSQFWDENILGNAGDDDVIGSNLDPTVWAQIFAACKDLFGVVVNLEQTGWDNLSITALEPTPEQRATAYYRHQLGMPATDFGIRTEPAKLLLTKTEFKMRTARLSDIPFRQAHVMSMIGTAWLAAYNPEIYNDLADMYLADMKYVLLRFYSKLTVTEERDQFGNLSRLLVTPAMIRPRYARVERRIDAMINAWLKTVKWPGYQAIFNVWVRPYSVERSSIAKRHRSLMAGGPALPVAYKLLYGLVGVREALYTIPNHLVRALPEFPGADISVTLRTPDFVIERFVWLSLFHKRKAVPTKAAFLSALKEGPYTAACHPTDFLEALEVGQNMQELIRTDLEQLRAQAMLVTIVYTFLEKLLNAAAQTPFLGVAVTLYALATRDVNRLYSLANHIFWLAEGRSSPIISNLMPADPYAWMKQVAVLLVTGVPPKWINIPGLVHLTTWVPTLCEFWVMGAATISPNVGRLTFSAHPPMNSPWAVVIDALLVASHDMTFETATVVAPTGSGKSTLFIALLRQVYPLRRIWLLHPTVAARDEYRNDFLPDGEVQIIQRGIDIRPDARVINATYGYFTQVISSVSEADVIVFDEIHLATTECFVAWWLAHGNIKLAMTATPKFDLQPSTQHTFVYPGTRRFKMKMTYLNQPFEQIFQALANSRPQLLSRALIICPTLTKVEFVRNTISRLSFASSELSSNNPVPARTGIIVATSIADQALTIEPPPTCVIDLGEMLTVSVRSQLGSLLPITTSKVVPVSQEVADQRAGRGGRAADSEGFGVLTGVRSPHVAPQRFPTAVYLHEDVVESVLASLGLRCALTVQQPISGVLQFVRVARHVLATNVSHSVALAAVCLLYMSSGTDFDTMKHAVLNALYASTVDDALRVYTAQVQQLFPELQPLLGDIHHVVPLLESGIFECQVREVFVPVAAFLFVDGWLTPAGSDPAMLFTGATASIFPSMLAPVVHRGLREPEWAVLLANIQVVGAPRAGRLTFDQPLQMLTLDGVSAGGGAATIPATAFAIQTMVRRLVTSRHTGALVEFTPLTTVWSKSHTVVLVSPHEGVAPLRGVLTLNVVGIDLSISLFFPLFLVMTASLMDDQYGCAGVLSHPWSANRLVRHERCLFWGPPGSVSCVVASPLAARRAWAEAGHHLSRVSCLPIFAFVQPVVMSGPDDVALWQAYVATAVGGEVVNNRLVLC